jgi:hypothetical protein
MLIIEESLRTLKVKSDHWLNRYLKIVSHFIENPPDNDYEVHHILPKALFPEYQKEKWNLVKLPLRHHYLAHYCLVKAIKHKKISYAFICMNSLNKNYTNSTLYALSRLQISTMLSYYNSFENMSEERKEKALEGIRKSHRVPGRADNIRKAYFRSDNKQRVKRFKENVSTIQESGLTKAQEIAQKSANTMRENGHYETLSKKMKVNLTLYDSYDRIVNRFESKKEFWSWCQDQGYPPNSLYRTFTKNNSYTSHIRNQHTKNADKIVGWYLRKG